MTPSDWTYNHHHPPSGELLRVRQVSLPVWDQSSIIRGQTAQSDAHYHWFWLTRSLSHTQTVCVCVCVCVLIHSMRILWSSVWRLINHSTSCSVGRYSTFVLHRLCDGSSTHRLMRLSAEFWYFPRQCFGPLFVCCGDGGVSLSLPPLRVVSSLRSCALGVGVAGGGWPLLNYGWRWRGDEGWPRGDLPPSIPNTSDSPLTPPPSSPSCSPLCPNSHHPRVAWGWMRVTGDVSLSLSVFLLCCFFSLVTLSSLSLSSSPSQISAGKVRMREVRSAGTGLQMLRKRDKDIQYLDFLPL